MPYLTYTGWELGNGADEYSYDAVPIESLVGVVSTSSARTRTGTYSLLVNAAYNAVAYFSTRAIGSGANDIYIKFDFYADYAWMDANKVDLWTSGGIEFCSLHKLGGIAKASLRWKTNGQIQVVDSTGSVIGQSSTTGHSLNRWSRIEFKVGFNLGGITSSYELRIDGATAASGTGNFLQATTGDGYDSLRLGRSSITGGILNRTWFNFDDLVVDTSGFPGGIKVAAMRPNADGSADALGSSWTKTGSTYWGSVDLPHDSATTYWQTIMNASTGKRTVELASAAASGISGHIRDVTVASVFGSSGTVVSGVNATTVEHFLSDGANETYQVSETITTNSYVGRRRAGWDSNPFTFAPWSVVDLANLKAGLRSCQPSSTALRMTTMVVLVAFDPTLEGALNLSIAARGDLSVTGSQVLAGRGDLTLTARGTLNVISPPPLIRGRIALSLTAKASLTVGPALKALDGAALISVRARGTLSAEPKGSVPRTRFMISLGGTT